MADQELITVHFTIDLTEAGGESLLFSRWLPIGKAEGLTFQHNGHSGVLWFEIDCIGHLGQTDKDEIARTINNHVDKMYAEISVNVDAELANFIKQRDCQRGHMVDEALLADAYRQLGVGVSDAVDHGISRFLAFVRIQKGQYWAPTRAFGGQAKARTADRDWFRWCPTNVIQLSATFTREDDPRMMRVADWESAQAFMTRGKPTLTLELLAGAEAFAKSGSHRAALTEAVSALEIALSVFARSSEQRHDWLPDTLKRIGVAGLPQLIDHLGLSGSVSTLLPLLFNADQLPESVLSACRDAIQQRQNVVHNGQRTVKSLGTHLIALRRMCEILLQHSRPDDH